MNSTPRPPSLAGKRRGRRLAPLCGAERGPIAIGRGEFMRTMIVNLIIKIIYTNLL